MGLNFGVFRYDRWNASKQYYMLFDMGASDTVATVLSYEAVKNSDNGYSETVPQMTVLGLGCACSPTIEIFTVYSYILTLQHYFTCLFLALTH